MNGKMKEQNNLDEKLEDIFLSVLESYIIICPAWCEKVPILVISAIPIRGNESRYLVSSPSTTSDRS